ncbi:MAG: hypothetical protein IPK19_16620 [Chloroflexi bacterium]|nr:hypothetical protein [Chloroflexota bacterium]
MPSSPAMLESSGPLITSVSTLARLMTENTWRISPTYACGVIRPSFRLDSIWMPSGLSAARSARKVRKALAFSSGGRAGVEVQQHAEIVFVQRLDQPGRCWRGRLPEDCIQSGGSVPRSSRLPWSRRASAVSTLESRTLATEKSIGAPGQG